MASKTGSVQFHNWSPVRPPDVGVFAYTFAGWLKYKEDARSGKKIINIHKRTRLYGNLGVPIQIKLMFGINTNKLFISSYWWLSDTHS